MPPLQALHADRWLDEEDVTASNRRSVKGALSPLVESLRRAATSARTTPGKFTIVSFILVVAILAAGLAVGLSADSRQTSLNSLVTRTEPLSNDAQELFNSLSVADSAITTGFLQKSGSNPAAKATFDDAITDASGAVVRAGHGITNVESREMELILSIQENLPQYMHLVAMAEANDRQLNPIGASYLTQASALMQRTMLPAAEELYTTTSSTLSKEQDRLVAPMWFPLTGLFAAVAMLFLAQIWLTAKTNRRINIGWFLAFSLMLIATLWSTISSAVVWYQGTQAVQSSVQPLEKLTQVRISVQQARSQEALGLIQRDYDERAQQKFSERILAIDKTLVDLRDEVDMPSHIDNAREALRQWDHTHASMVAQIREGDYQRAISVSMAEEAGEGPKSFTTLDEDLQNLISITREDLQHVLIGGRVAAARISMVVVIMTILAALLVVLGIRPRMQEFL
ncbi:MULTISPECIES: hypothetical protein [Corynebacterium]|nr:MULTISPECIES: hypothetical protein [Corynebacterium]QNP92502.1 hypothetical protein IAU67_01335 [Corynebacterium zhongnanshanii]